MNNAPRFLRLAVSATILLLVLGTSVFPMVAQAQNPTSPFGNRQAITDEDLANAYRPPKIFVYSLKITKQTETTIDGVITVFNGDEHTVGDLQYRIELYGAPENQLLYDRVMGSETFAMPPMAYKDIPFTYTIPNVAAGEYKLQAQLLTSKGRTYGWGEADVTINTSSSNFIHLYTGTLNLPEFPGQTIHPLSGPNISAGKQLSILGTFENKNGQAITVVPKLAVYAFDMARGNAETISFAPLTLAAGEKRKFELPVTVSQKPEVYSAYLWLETPGTTQKVSSLAEYRWIVRGLDADVLSARITSLGTKKGEIVFIQTDYVGPADAETTGEGTLTVTLRDEAGVIGELPVPNVTLDDRIRSGIVRVELQRDLVGAPTVRTEITSTDGQVLDSHDTTFPLSSDEIKTLSENQPIKQRLVWYKPLLTLTALVLVAGLAFAFGIYTIKRRRK